MKQPARSLAQQHMWWLAAALLSAQLLTVLLVLGLVMRPLGQRYADDLAGLMVLSAQTWAELPPQARPAFKTELLAAHGLDLARAVQGSPGDEWHAPFFFGLEGALARRLGKHQHLLRVSTPQGTWYWVNLPSGTQQVAIGLSAQRMGSQPLVALGLALALAVALATGLGLWLARRIARPLARLEQAALAVGSGGLAPPLPEDGPRELVQLAQRFNTMAAQVRTLLSARTTLLAGVSHDLRTPLARMRLALEMLKDGHNPALLARLEADIDHMNQLIGNVLEVARGMAHEPPVLTHLAPLLHTLAAEHAPPNRPIEVTCPAHGTHPVPVLALRRALGNLLQNALRHAPGGPVSLLCTLQHGHCTLHVLDRGPGMTEAQAVAMLEPFTRLESSRSPASGGSGLGLAIVNELARANGWRLWLGPRPGGGLCARIDLPDVAALAG